MDHTITNESLKKMFMKYVSLGIFSMMGISLVVFVDTFFIANGVGSRGIAALNIVLPMLNLFNGLGWMLGVGGATLYSIARGEGKLQEGRQNFTLTVVVGLILSVFFMVLTLIFADSILRFLGANESIFEMSKGYYMIIMGVSPLFILNNMFITFLRNDNGPKLAMIGMIIGALCNIILDYLFIFPFGWGLQGAALATATSPAVSLLISLFHLKNQKRQLNFSKFSFQFKKVKEIFSIGFASFLNEFSSALVMFLFNIVLLQLVGNIGVSAYAIIANMNIVVIALFTGIGQGFQPLVSTYHGARESNTVKKLLKYGLLTSIIFGVVFLVLGIVLTEEIVALFNNEQDLVLQQLAEQGLVLYFISFLMTGVNFAVIYFMSAVEKPRPSYIISLLRSLILIFPVLFVMADLMGLVGVWLTMPIVEFLTIICAIPIIVRYVHYFLQTDE